MKGLPPELIYVLIFAVIVLFQYMMKRYGPQEEQSPASEEILEEFPAEETANSAMVAGATVGHFGGAEASGHAVPTRQDRRFSRSSLMGSKREMQKAIAIATILGPCRAFEPHDIK
mgnify:CR=1 FL=1